VFWSNKRGININNAETYSGVLNCATVTHVGDVTHHTVVLKTNYDWIYFVIAKKGFFTKEFEAKVSHVDVFDLKHVSAELIHRDHGKNIATVKFAVIGSATEYEIFQYFGDGTMESQKMMLDGDKHVNVKISTSHDVLIYASAKIEDFWTPQEFFIHLEKFDLVA
jgi:hypothetical protein